MGNSLVMETLLDDRPAKDDSRILNFQKGGYVIRVGKNSFSNERLVADHPHRDCLHLHALAARGSHVIICFHGKSNPPEEVLMYAAELAIQNSHSQARTVSVSLLKNVFKPENAGVGIWKSSRVVCLEVPE